MGPEAQEWISGNFAGQKIALVMLVKLLHEQKAIEGHAYSNALKVAFSDPNMQHDRTTNEYLKNLAAALDQELEAMDRTSPSI